MCISDWRLGRHIRSVITSKALPINDTLSIPANPLRVGIRLSISTYANSAVQAPTVFCDGIAVCLLHQGQQFYDADIRFHGDMVIKSWNITSTAGLAVIATAVEYFLDAKTIDTQYNEFKRG